MIISFSLLYSLAFPPSFLSSLSSFVFLPSLHLFFFSFSFSQLLLFFLFFSYFFLSLNISHSLFLSSFISLFHPLSFNYTLFLSLSLLFHFSFSLSLFSSHPIYVSIFHIRFFSFSLHAMFDFAWQRIDCRSIRVPFPPCCALPLYGHVYRERRRVLFTGRTVALVLRTHVVEIKFPLSSRHTDALRLLWYRFPRIFQRMAYLPGIVSWPRRREQVNGHAAVRFISVLFPLFSLSLCFPSSYIFFLSFCTRNNYPMGKFKYSHNLSCFIIIEHGEQLYSIFREKCLTSY